MLIDSSNTNKKITNTPGAVTASYRNSCYLSIQPTSTMNKVLGFECGNIQSTRAPNTLETTTAFQSFTMVELNEST